jgi:hypothetical protein
MDDTTAARFWAKVDRDGGDGCWVWLGARHQKGNKPGSRLEEPPRPPGALLPTDGAVPAFERLKILDAVPPRWR